jgi:hypothetical protein
MTRQEIIDLVTPAVGHGYKWGGSTWTQDASRLGACQMREGAPDGCPACDFPAGAVGADCAGLVGKAWQLSRAAAIDEDFRPYSAGNFFSGTNEWEQISFDELKPGDGLARRSHTVLFDQMVGRRFLTWEAKGCQWNIVHESRSVNTQSGEWVAIRRLDLSEPVACTPSTCNGHGSCADGRCACDEGYAGDRCERCSTGFVGFPACVRAAESCTPQGTLACEQIFSISPERGQNQLDGYSCDNADRSSNELVYQFAPLGSGKARVSLSGPGAVLALRNACSPEACVASGAAEVELDYGGGEVFFLAVESAGSNADVTVRVDCEDGDTPWVGDACNADSDCVMTRPSGEVLNGRCYGASAGSGGFCTLSCTRGCPDLLPNKAATFCIADPAAPAMGMCVSKSERANDFCARVPGAPTTTAPRFQDETNTASVCAPALSPPACEGELLGTITSSIAGQGIPGAEVQVVGGTALSLVTGPDGAYASGKLPCGTYTLAVSALGFLVDTVTAIVTASSTSHVTRLRALSEGQCTGDGDLQGNVFEAISESRAPISGASLELRRGVDTDEGEVVASATTDAEGVFVLTGLASGNYTALAAADGYAPASANVVVCGGSPSDSKGIALTPTQTEEMRIVLEWDRPDDLDLHLQLPNGDEIFFDGPCRGGLEGAYHASLDIDRITPSGPETITIERFVPGLYTAFVHNFSGQNEGASDFSDSGARVRVLGPGDVELGRFAVPSNGGGNFWNVFQFQGARPEELVSLQQLNDARANPYDEYTGECRP